MPRANKHLYDIHKAGGAVLRFVDGRTFAEYSADDFLRSAVERQFQIVGEALTRLRRDDPATLDTLTAVPQIIAFRNIVVHAYDNVDDSKVWDVIERHLSVLLSEVEARLITSGDWPPADEE